jgi:hypothetical protein
MLFFDFWFLVSSFWLSTEGAGPAAEPETRAELQRDAHGATGANQKLETTSPEPWRVILEPKFMHRAIAWEIPGAQRTEMTPVVVDGNEYLFPSLQIWERFHVDRSEIVRRGAAVAAADLATLKPRYERNNKQVIEYAELTSDRPIVASAVLAPKFLDLFRDTLGEKVLLVVPSRFTAYVFPALASNYQDYYPMVNEAYHATVWPISMEVFEVGPEGIRTVGMYHQPEPFGFQSRPGP